MTSNPALIPTTLSQTSKSVHKRIKTRDPQSRKPTHSKLIQMLKEIVFNDLEHSPSYFHCNNVLYIHAPSSLKLGIFFHLLS